MAEIKSSSPAPEFQTEGPQQSPLEQFLEKNFKSVMIALAVLAIVVASWGVMRYLANQSAQEAAERVTSASSPEDFDIVVQKYPGSIAAGDALLLKAQSLWTDGKKDSSVAALRQFVKDYGTHPLQVPTILGLASKLTAMGEKAEARQMLDTALKNNPQSEFAPALQIQLGDLLWEEGKNDEAKKLFESLPRLYPAKMMALNDAVTQRLEWMNAGLPTTEVEPPPAPKPVTPPPGAIPASGPALMPPAMAPPQINLPPMIAPPAIPSAPPAAAPAIPSTPAAAPAPKPPAPEAEPVHPVDPAKPAAEAPAPGTLPVPPPPDAKP